jgi:hypothetical protein
MGFETVEVLLKDFENGQNIMMNPSTYELDEVLVFDKQLSVEEILEKFNTSAKINHQLSNAKVQVFARFDDEYEALTFGLDIKKASFLSKGERKDMNTNLVDLGKKIQKNSSKSYRERLLDIYAYEDTLVNTYQKALDLINRENTFNTDNIQDLVFYELLKSLKSENSFKVKTGIIPLDKDLSLNEIIEDLEKQKSKLPDTLFNKNTWSSKSYKRRATQFTNDFFTTPKYYTYELVGVTKVYGQPCYHIKFFPDRRKGKYEGDLFINTQDFGMVSYKYDVVDGKKTMNLNLKFVLGIKAYTFQDSGFFVFSKNNKDTYYPKYIKQTDGSYAYINRSLSFKENNPNRSKRKQLKLEFELEFNIIETIEYVGIQYQNVTKEDIPTSSIEDFIIIDEIDKYDPNYWKDYNIIEATDAIKTYE